MAEDNDAMDWPSWSATAAVVSVLSVGLTAIVSYRSKKNSINVQEQQRLLHEQQEQERKEAEKKKAKEEADRLAQEAAERQREEERKRKEEEERKAKEAEASSEEEDLIKDHAAIEEMNESGLVRGRKTTSIREGRRQKQIYQMEDISLVEAPLNGDLNRALFVVFDGHAGRFAAEAAKNCFTKHVLQHIDGSTGAVDFEKVFKDVETELAAEQGKYDCEGCTCTAAYLYRHNGKRYLQVANVGDSSAFLAVDGQAVMVSVDHKVSNPAERERMKSMGVPIEDRHTRLPTIGLAVSRALGDFFAKEVKSGLSGEPFIYPTTQLGPEHTHLILASDGLWDIVSGQKAVDIVRTKNNASDASAALIEAALASADCQDNVTVITVFL